MLNFEEKILVLMKFEIMNNVFVDLKVKNL